MHSTSSRVALPKLVAPGLVRNRLTSTMFGPWDIVSVGT